jgi:hypothetical protein
MTRAPLQITMSSAKEGAGGACRHAGQVTQVLEIKK